jgi:hypothetical protein
VGKATPAGLPPAGSGRSLASQGAKHGPRHRRRRRGHGWLPKTSRGLVAVDTRAGRTAYRLADAEAAGVEAADAEAADDEVTGFEVAEFEAVRVETGGVEAAGMVIGGAVPSWL